MSTVPQRSSTFSISASISASVAILSACNEDERCRHTHESHSWNEQHHRASRRSAPAHAPTRADEACKKSYPFLLRPIRDVGTQRASVNRRFLRCHANALSTKPNGVEITNVGTCMHACMHVRHPWRTHGAAQSNAETQVSRGHWDQHDLPVLTATDQAHAKHTHTHTPTNIHAPPIKTAPSSTSYSRRSSLNNVDLPTPFFPQMATKLPALMVNESLSYRYRWTHTHTRARARKIPTRK